MKPFLKMERLPTIKIPQCLFNDEAPGIAGQLITREKSLMLTFDIVGSLDINYNERSHLFVAIANNLDIKEAQANLCTPNEKLKFNTITQTCIALVCYAQIQLLSSHTVFIQSHSLSI